MPTRRYPWATHGQMTLGALADAIAALPPTLMIPALCAPHSYRGTYGDGATLTARCTLAQSLRAMEAAQWLLGRAEAAANPTP